MGWKDDLNMDRKSTNGGDLHVWSLLLKAFDSSHPGVTQTIQSNVLELWKRFNCIPEAVISTRSMDRECKLA